jgi:hypothetical protein
VSNRRRLRGKDWEPLSQHIRTITGGREAQLRTEIETIAPGFLDQLGAASADGRRSYAEFLGGAKADHPSRAAEVDARQVPQQIVDQITGLYIRVMTEVATGERAHCGHVSLYAPRPAVACVHTNWICCRPCFTRKATRPMLTEREEHTCDLCGTWRPKQTMHALYPQVGPVMLIIGICPTCRTRITQPHQENTCA